MKSHSAYKSDKRTSALLARSTGNPHIPPTWSHRTVAKTSTEVLSGWYLIKLMFLLLHEDILKWNSLPSLSTTFHGAVCYSEEQNGF